jgi:peroxiredoxin
MRASSEYTPNGISRKPDSWFDGVDAWAILTSALSGLGGSAVEAWRATPAGKVPHAASVSAAAHGAALRTSTRAASIARPKPHPLTSGRFWQDRVGIWNAQEFGMKKLLAVGVVVLSIALPARAALDVGESAPDFTTAAALAGKVFKYSLAESLAKGPVVLYFFPAAFSEGCSIEAHQFAEAIGKFEALGASVIGVSGDDIETLSKFSQQACQGKFPVASDGTKSIIRSYDAAMQTRPDFANRVSYVIAPNGSVAYSYLSLNPHKHVEKTLAAVAELSKALTKK